MLEPPARGASRRALLEKAFRYGLAAVGPVGAAVSQFLLSLQLLRMMQPAQFGAFSFLLVTSQFSNGVWSALFCAPLPVLMGGEDAARREAMLRALFTANLLGAAIAFLIFWALGASLGAPTPAALFFAGYGALALLRWFGRAYAYVTSAPMRTTASDLLYTLTLFAGVVLIQFRQPDSLTLPHAALCLSAAVSLLPFGKDYLSRQFVRLSLRETPLYGEVWRRHSSWSLTGVVTTEATANAHAYLVTFFLGPGAFAPLSASALLIRPISVVTNALSDFERPQMAREIHENRLDRAERSVRLFRLALMAMWVATAAGAAALLAYAPQLIFPSRYPLAEIATGAALWMAVSAIRLLRTPESILLQAGGMFRPLAYASMISCGVSIAAVGALLALGGPLWSIAGIFIGEAIYAFWVWRQARRWRAAETAKSTAP
ncbi:hypothetical protein [Terrarubrum flagellatum]|uniref:lipopolysaccharide biosynthesis protein n=1 Tax=Terrirubrum flagellatum TaxID=2895980 RepID=UPI00314548AB